MKVVIMWTLKSVVTFNKPLHLLLCWLCLLTYEWGSVDISWFAKVCVCQYQLWCGRVTADNVATILSYTIYNISEFKLKYGYWVQKFILFQY